MSKKKNVALQSKARKNGINVFELRDYLVMLAADVAEIFNVETWEIVQNIKRNNEGIRPIFPGRLSFTVHEVFFSLPIFGNFVKSTNNG